MKRILAFILLLTTVLNLCACTGTPTTSTDTNTDTPTEQTQPTEPEKSEAVTNIESLIEALSKITTFNQETYKYITEIQTLYNKLSSAEQAQVENYTVFSSCIKTAATQIDDAISNIGTVSTKNRQALIDAMKLYNAAPAEVQAYVTDAATLKSAADTVAESMLSTMYKEEDFVRNMAFYYHNQWPRGNKYWYADERCFPLPYLGKQNDNVWLRFVCNYTEDDWVFFESIIFACDDQRFYKTFSYYDIVRDNDSGEVWEYIDMEVTAYEIKILEAIANSEKTIIRFQGDDYSHDFTVTAKDKEAIRFTLDLYYLLGGK